MTKKERQLELEQKIKKLIAEVMRAVGFIFLSAFALLGSVFYYTNKGSTNIIDTIVISVIVTIMLFAMTQVKDKW